ncbi:MAG: IS630 family transposase [Candidatus Altiarchaeia archaeon]
MVLPELVQQVSLSELKHLVKKSKDARVRHRLLFIRQLYEEDSMEEACERMCISLQTGYDWLSLWNKAGEGALPPQSGGGRPPKLRDEQKLRLMDLLKSKEHWLTGEVCALVRKEFSVSYSLRHVRKILRNFGMYYAKPYVLDVKRPQEAEKILAERLREALQEKEAVVGFLDEASPQTKDNTQRVWSFTKPKKSKNTAYYKANTFGFYPLNGKEVLEFKEQSKAGDLCDFLRQIRMKNPKNHLIIILDNARSHLARQTRRFAELLDISLIFLPPYSPDLNPIEYIWMTHVMPGGKSVRKRLSQIANIKSEWSLKETIKTTFHQQAKKLTYAQNWIQTFTPNISS